MPSCDALNFSKTLGRSANLSLLGGLPLLIATMLGSVENANKAPHSLSLSGQSLVRASGGLLKEGSAYVTLQRMQKRGLVTSHQEMPMPDQAGVIVNRLYTLTPAGRAALLRTQAAEKSKKGRPS